MFRKLMSNNFNKQALTLISGTSIAQAIPIAISPILTRLYSPSDFGVLALFISITAIIGTIANGRYEVAVVLPNSEKDAINVAALATVISSSISILLLFIMIFWGNSISLLLGEESILPWLYLAPISTFFIGLFNVLNYLNTRTESYSTIAKANVLKMFSLSVIQLSSGVLKAGAGGLIIGQMASFIFGNTIMRKNSILSKNNISTISIKKMKEVGLRYIDFPKYSLGAILANTLSRNIVNIFISSIFSLATLGFYSLVQRVLGTPSQLIGKAIGQVFYKKCVDQKQKTGKADKIYQDTLIKLLILSIPSFTLLYIFSESIIVFVFGEEWILAGTYTKILIPLFFIRFIVLPLSMINGAFEKQRISLFWQLGLLLLTIFTFIITSFNNGDIIFFLNIYTWIMFAYHLLLLLLTYLISKGKI